MTDFIITSDTPGSDTLIVLKDGEPLGCVIEINVQKKSCVRWDLAAFQEHLESGNEEPPTREERPDAYIDDTFDGLLFSPHVPLSGDASVLKEAILAAGGVVL